MLYSSYHDKSSFASQWNQNIGVQSPKVNVDAIGRYSILQIPLLIVNKRRDIIHCNTIIDHRLHCAHNLWNHFVPFPAPSRSGTCITTVTTSGAALNGKGVCRKQCSRKIRCTTTVHGTVYCTRSNGENRNFARVHHHQFHVDLH